MNLQGILAAIQAALNIASGLGVPVTGLVAKLIPVLNELVNGIVERSKGEKTRDEILAQIGIETDSEIAILMETAARGE